MHAFLMACNFISLNSFEKTKKKEYITTPWLWEIWHSKKVWKISKLLHKSRGSGLWLNVIVIVFIFLDSRIIQLWIDVKIIFVAIFYQKYQIFFFVFLHFLGRILKNWLVENISAFKYISNDAKLFIIRQMVGKLSPKIKTLHTFLTQTLIT